MIIWQGGGGITALIILLTGLLVIAAVNAVGGQAPPWVIPIAWSTLAAAGNAVYVNKYLPTEARHVIDKKTGQELQLVTKHTLFWIPVRYWTYIIIAYGVIGVTQSQPT